MMITKIALLAALLPSPQASLVLSVTNEAKKSSSVIRVVRLITLTCDPDGGRRHPDPTAACDLLREHDGDLAAYPGKAGACTREHDPHTVRLSGKWKGLPVSYERTFGNRCEMLLATGPIFDF